MLLLTPSRSPVPFPTPLSSPSHLAPLVKSDSAMRAIGVCLTNLRTSTTTSLLPLRHQRQRLLDLQRLFLLQIPKCIRLFWKSHCQASVFNWRSLCKRFCPCPRLHYKLDAGRGATHTCLKPCVNYQHLHGHGRWCQRYWREDQLRNVFSRSSDVQGQSQWPAHGHCAGVFSSGIESTCSDSST